MKSCKDGADRDETPLNALICLDVSGSMNGGLGDNPKHGLSRLKLSIEAIKMFISKLRPTDSFGLVTFNNHGRTIIKPTLKADITNEVFAML